MDSNFYSVGFSVVVCKDLKRYFAIHVYSASFGPIWIFRYDIFFNFDHYFLLRILFLMFIFVFLFYNSLRYMLTVHTVVNIKIREIPHWLLYYLPIMYLCWVPSHTWQLSILHRDPSSCFWAISWGFQINPFLPVSSRCWFSGKLWSKMVKW